MIQSMTGFGNTEFEWRDTKTSIQIRAINSKNMDIRFRLPGELEMLEPQLRSLCIEKLMRGKIDINISFDKAAEGEHYKINTKLFAAYYKQMRELQNQADINIENFRYESILNFPGILVPVEKELQEDDIRFFLTYFEKTLNEVIKFRQSEGKALHRDISQNINRIMTLLESIDVHEENRIQKIKERLNTKLEGLEVDMNRYEQEIIYYLDKLDINEEKVRLQKHCSYFLETLDSPASQGKKLGFIAQEILREINTLGSKANDAGMQRIVVNMKSELEKVKEQLGNVL